MKLNPIQASTFRAWLSARGGVLLDCPVCRQRDWLPPELVSTPRSAPQADTGNPSPETFEEYLITCSVCGFTHHFSASVVGRSKLL